MPFSSINDSRLYSVLDVLRTHKDKLCACLHERYRSCSVVESEFLLYDVASRYFDCLRESASAIWCPPKSQLKPSRGNSSPAGLGPSAAPAWKSNSSPNPTKTRASLRRRPGKDPGQDRRQRLPMVTRTPYLWDAASFVSSRSPDVRGTGVTGMNILRAIVAGERDCIELAKLKHPAPRRLPRPWQAHYCEEHLLALKSALSAGGHQRRCP